MPVVGLNTLDFLAASVSDRADAIVCSAVDARNENVYCNVYIDGKALWECKVRSVSHLKEDLEALSRKTGRRVIVTGDGAQKYFAEFTAAPDRELPGVAAVLCKMAADMQEQAADCFQLNVNYYRQTQAERMKNERA